MKEMEAVAMVAFLICILSFTNADTDPTDASTLNILYTSLNSPQQQLTNWKPSGGDPCGESWRGITCSGSKVTEIKISGLGLTGNMGFQLDRLTSVTTFDISNNNLGNQIPYQLPPNVQRLNLSHNQIQGQVTVQFNMLTALSTLDFSYNALSDNLPQSFTSLTSINDMYLQNNQFTGTLDVLANLPLQNLNVENNRFTGWIPQQLRGINLHKSGIGGGAIAGIVISILVVGAIVAFFIIKRRSRKSSTDIEKLDNQPFAPLASQEQEVKPVQTSSAASTKAFETPATINLRPPPIDRHKSFDEDDVSVMPIVPPKKVNRAPINAKLYSVADLQIATDSFSVENLIGEGSIGRVYRAQLDDGKVVAVKKINSSALSNSKIFLTSCQRFPRCTIQMYLHEVCSPSVIHKNFKSANILLDMELNPHLSDCVLVSLVREPDQASGYSAPEVAMSGQYTIKSDVYSLGFSRPRSEQSLVRWATPQLHDIDALSKMVDPALKGLYPVKSLSRFADVIALCVQPEPEFRPPMSEVVQALVRLVQRANMSKRTFGNEAASTRADNADGEDYTP
ncbi:hypothetical protein DH2020_047530 [Rehmannia glutinosa]|uniref:Protein kinase domain-containing protein n=1 Tax=Rehmannia glutinosa TaxID=99300 RepID=A0ABR0U966_REHGL